MTSGDEQRKQGGQTGEIVERGPNGRVIEEGEIGSDQGSNVDSAIDATGGDRQDGATQPLGSDRGSGTQSGLDGGTPGDGR